MGNTKKGILIVALLCSFAQANPTSITYSLTNTGPSSWQYEYEVSNLALSPAIYEFTIYFDWHLYDNLVIATPEPPAGDWDELVWQPDPLWSIDGGYDALTLGSGIGQDGTVSGFAVSFDWLGTGTPGPQWYDIIKPPNYNEPVDSGWTTSEPVTIIPAPGALMLTVIGLGIIGFRKKHKAL